MGRAPLGRGGAVSKSWVIDEETATAVEQAASDAVVSESHLVRDLLRRGLADYQREQEMLRTLQKRAG